MLISDLLSYAIKPAVVVLFGMYPDRVPAFIGTMPFMNLAWGVIVPERHTWTRNVINFLIFHLSSHISTTNVRTLYTLRDQLKLQFRATQEAQANESKAADFKCQHTSYFFYEVRVPLNTALLAVQKPVASRDIYWSRDIQFAALKAA
ncbi:hypothetical protein BC629DRAFT_1596697 [Irpex lacteus]|nr:hypothetical protein BC629DRAFT_1596697 [Irpex lacteus]